MDEGDLIALVEDIRSGLCAPDDAVARLRRLPFADLGFARVDHHRALRIGVPEAVYGPGKTPAQCAAIVAELLAGGTGPVLLTRATGAQVTAALATAADGVRTPADAEDGRLSTLVWRPAPVRPARVLVVAYKTAATKPLMDAVGDRANQLDGRVLINLPSRLDVLARLRGVQPYTKLLLDDLAGTRVHISEQQSLCLGKGVAHETVLL